MVVAVRENQVKGSKLPATCLIVKMVEVIKILKFIILKFIKNKEK